MLTAPLWNVYSVELVLIVCIFISPPPEARLPWTKMSLTTSIPSSTPMRWVNGNFLKNKIAELFGSCFYFLFWLLASTSGRRQMIILSSCTLLFCLCNTYIFTCSVFITKGGVISCLSTELVPVLSCDVPAYTRAGTAGVLLPGTSVKVAGLLD